MLMRNRTEFPATGARRMQDIGSSFRLAVWAATLIVTLPGHAAEEPLSSIPTVGGVMKVVQGQTGNRLTLNGKPVYRVEGGRTFPMEDDIVVLKRKYRVGANDTVLVQTNCGGTGCGGYSTLRFVTVTPAGKSSVSDGIEADEEGNAEVTVAGDQLVVTTVTMDGRRKKTHTWAYANGAVKATK